MTDALNSEARATVVQSLIVPGLCDVCRKPLSAHDTGAGIPICRGIYAPGYRSTLNDALAFARPADDAAVLAEREACARVADKSKMPVPHYSENPQQDFQRTVAPIINQTSSAIAAAIRARSDAAGEAK